MAMLPSPREDFGDLPAALVEELINGISGAGENVSKWLNEIEIMRESVRSSLVSSDLLRRVDDLPHIPPFPTTCGVDGSYVVDSFIGCDLVVVAAVAVEGLTPPNESRHWPDPHYSHFLGIEPHRQNTRLYARALMTIYELMQAAKAPHDVVLIDGSFISPISALHQAFTRLEAEDRNSNNQCMLYDALKKEINQAVLAYRDIVLSQRSDRIYLAVPKYTSRRELTRLLGLQTYLDDRALSTLLLRPGEFIGPIPIESPSESNWSGYHLTDWCLDDKARQAKSELEVALAERIQVVYFRPAPSNPALRVEVPQAVSSNPYRLARGLEALRSQSSVPGLLEPQPLYYADRMAKSLSSSVPALHQQMVGEALENYNGDISDVFFALHAYRTEEEW